MIRLTFLLALTSIFSLQVYAQHSHDRGVCGTNEIDIERTKANIAYAKANPLQSRMTTYIPIRFHLFGESDGTNAAPTNSLLDLMSAVNTDFAPFDMQFFLEDGDGTVWDYTYSDDIYDNHADFLPFLRGSKASNAITVYVPNTATPPNSSGQGVTLGYYSPSNDFLVFKKSEVGANASTASHEIGHYFSLPHTFRGWDCTSWNGINNDFTTTPVMDFTAPCSNVPVELVTRGADANCATAGDLFCDTPADYNLGFGWNNCTYSGNVQDRTGAPLRPMENNFMGYFLDCNPYAFTPEQVSTINADLASNGRNFLRGSSPTTTAVVSELANLVFPEDEGTTEYRDRTGLNWDAVPNAKYYYIELSDRRSLRDANLVFSGIVANPSAVVDNLEAGTTYYWRVRAFNQVSFGDYGQISEFTTATVSGLSSQPQAVDAMTLFPNPTIAGSATTLKMESSIGGEFTLSIRDLTGRTISTSIEQINVGENSINLGSLVPTVKGSYILSVRNAKGISSQKFEVL